MDQFSRIIESINSQEDYQEKFSLLLSIVLQQEGTNTSRPETVRLLESIDRVITSNSEIHHKFYAIMIAKDLFSRQYSQFISSLSNSKLLQSMLYIALNTDPSKRVQEKGRALYGDLGNDYITLILQCLVKWSDRYPENTRRGAPTKFRLTHQQLTKQRVVLPKQFRFFDNGLNRAMPNQEKRSNQFNPTSSEMSENLSTRALEVSIKNSVMKIQGFFNYLDETDDVEKLRSEIERYHRIFEQEYNKNELQIDRILADKLLDEESTNHFLGIQEFYHNEKEAYNKFLRNSDELKQYIDTIALSTQQIKEKLMNKNKLGNSDITYNLSSHKNAYPSFTNERAEEERVVYERRVTTDVVTTNPMPNPGRSSYGRVEQAYVRVEYPEESTFNMKGYQAKRETEPIHYGGYEGDSNLKYHRSMGNNPQGYVIPNQYDEGESGRSGYFQQEKQLSNQAERGHILIKEMMSKVSTKTGFGKIKKQLDEERSLSNRSRNPNRTRRSKSPRPMSRYRRFQQQSQFSQSRDVSRLDPIEISPIKVTKNDYTGTLIQTTRVDMSDMSRDQGWKKYHKSNLKPKGILFQNQHLQIGYKSQAIYEDLQSFNIFIKIGIYIGNKISDTITRVDTDYEGDQSAIMYLNPKRIDETIIKGQQVKQDLVIIPLLFPCNPISCVLQYSLKRESHTVVFYLPNTILKLSTTQPINPQKFNQYYQTNRSNEYRSNVFKLSKDWPHSSLSKLFDNTVVLTDYETFVSQRSYCEYVLGFYFEVLESENYLCKLVVRPDLTAVIQVVMVDGSKQSLEYGTALLQSLQSLLQSEEEYQ